MTADGQHIVVAGDWHGSTTWAVEVIRRAAAQRISTVVHVGDLGIGPWVGRPDTLLPALDAALDRFGCRLLVVPDALLVCLLAARAVPEDPPARARCARPSR